MKEFDPLQQSMLNRLEHISNIRLDSAKFPINYNLKKRLVTAAYEDCYDLKVAKEAQEVLGKSS